VRGQVHLDRRAKVGVSADSRRVTAYADGVETRGAGSARKGTQISVSNGFDGVVRNGVTIEQTGDRHLVITAPLTVFIKDAAANDSEPNVGGRMRDGTIYAGISPDTGRKMFTTAADAPLTMKWKTAMDYAGLETPGHDDWRVPSKGELNVPAIGAV